MRTITTDYGNPRLTEPATLQLGIRTREVDGVPHYYGHVYFPASKAHKQTRLVTDQEGLKTFITQVAKDVRTKNFPFADKDGKRQWFDFDPNAATL